MKANGNPSDVESSRARSIVPRKSIVIGLEKETENLRALLYREACFYPPCLNYFPSFPCSTKSYRENINEDWRCSFCEWFYEVVDHFDYERDVVSIALDYLDRTLAMEMTASSEIVSKRKFQLIAVTCLYMALKLHEARGKMKISDYVELSHGFFQIEAIEAMERRVLSGLDWRLNPPTRLSFVAYLIRLCPEWSSNKGVCARPYVIGGIYDVARYLTELSVQVSAFSFTFKNSITAFACIYCAIEVLQHDLPVPCDVRMVFLNNMEKVTGLSPVMPEVRWARKMIKDICPSMFEKEEIPREFLAGRTPDSSRKSVVVKEAGINSPVSVNAQLHNYHSASGHKRNRTCCGKDNNKARRVLDAN